MKLIIDALDECDEDEVRDMTTFFSRLGEDAVCAGRALRVLFSSRHYPHITIQRSIGMKLEDQNGHSQDIERYVSSELKVGRGKQVRQVRQEIAERASGVFMWVVLVVQILNKAFDHGHVHALQKKLREIPDDLNELFRSILTRDCQNMDEMKLCLQWILHASRPLKREELYYAILSGLEPQELGPWDPDIITAKSIDLFILSSSKGLAEVTKSRHHTVQFIHESIREFLLKDNGLSHVWADLRNNSIGLSHDRLKICCSNYLEMDIAGHLGIGESLPPASSPAGSELRKKASIIFPFLEYAVRHIFYHANFSHAEGIDQECFIKQLKLSDWIQLHNIVERYQVRRLPTDIDLPYVFAERNCASLIDISIRCGRSTPSQNGQYSNPIFAAIATDSREAFEAFVSSSIRAYGYCHFPYYYDDMCSFLIKHVQKPLVHRFLSVFHVDVILKLKSGESMLSWALKNGHENIAELLVSRGPDVNAQDWYYGNAICVASAQGHKHIIDVLLSRGVEVNARGGTYGNALCAASAHGHQNIVEMLVDRGADVDGQGGIYGNALCTASEQGRYEVVQLLLDRGAYIDIESGQYSSALCAASARGHEKVVQLLLDRGANINAQDEGFGSPLFAASAGGHREIVELLLNRDVDVNAEAIEYGTALSVASYRGHIEVVQLLLDGGADANAQNEEDGNALCIASHRGYKEIVQLLLDRGANINAQDKACGSALCAALVRGYEGIVDLLLNRNANVNMQVDFYGSALQAALIQRYDAIPREPRVGMYRAFPPRRSTPNHALQDYQMQLMLLEQQNKKRLLAARENTTKESTESEENISGIEKIYDSHVKLLELLLSRAADVNIQGGKYGNALQAASALGSVRAVMLLLDRGADINVQGGEYGTALQAAKSKGHERIVELLCSRSRSAFSHE